MISENSLKDILSQDFIDIDKALICLAIMPIKSKSIKEIKELAVANGWRQVKKKNLSSIFSRSKGHAIRSSKGWELTTKGKEHISKLTSTFLITPASITSSSLRKQLDKIKNSETKDFVIEAISCFEAHQYRAAVVLSWIGAISMLHANVVENKLSEFNTEARKRNSKWKFAKTTDDLCLMKEDTFLDILQSISIIGKNVKQELKKCLILRNGCGHPNSLKLAENKVAAHIEDLILNVFSVF